MLAWDAIGFSYQDVPQPRSHCSQHQEIQARYMFTEICSSIKWDCTNSHCNISIIMDAFKVIKENMREIELHMFELLSNGPQLLFFVYIQCSLT